MAPRTRTRTSTTRQSVDTTAGAPSLPNCNDPDDDRGPSRFIPKPDEVEHTQEKELEAVPQQPYAYVLGREMLVPQTYDPDSYDPDGPVPWTPEPEPYDLETYAAWGRKHLGEEWYKLRETMLRERNIYRVSNPVYLERQKGEMSNKDWKRLWSRLCKILPRVQPPTPASSHADGSDGDTDLSGFSTCDPTPEPREPSPVFNDP
ncbi:hypothetical protein B0T16DRAFT_458113 [Cercophora newfieldiana]|uniref:Uncharacterized protein n=1 Tax=Cercophora newfieldiana TaxID=92897 RepID=A0AA39Y5M8_9PEZI|nr:hypothetical protein B0T16DRAFT_458113 [Cercophora newfieldiana]